MITTYYIGEFGHFNLTILERLEKYNGDKLQIYTFPDYCFIIKNLFNDKFDLVEIPFKEDRICSTCLNTNDFNSYLPLVKIIGDREYFNREPTIRIYNNISKKIESTYKNDIGDFICIFPRKRNIINGVNFAERNMNINICNDIINKYITKYKIIVIGNEIQDIDYEKTNIIKSNNINETIYYLANCKFLVSPCSGMVDFAKNCGTKLIFIIGPMSSPHFSFNPFNTKCFNINDINILSDEFLYNNILNKLYFTNNITEKEYIIQKNHIILKDFIDYTQKYMIKNNKYYLNDKKLFKLYVKHMNQKLIYNNINRNNIKYSIVIINNNIERLHFTIKILSNLLNNNWEICLICNYNTYTNLIKEYKNINYIIVNYIDDKPNYYDLIVTNNNIINKIKGNKILFIDHKSYIINNSYNNIDEYDFITINSNIYSINKPFIIKKELLQKILNINKIDLINNNSLSNNLQKIIEINELGKICINDSNFVLEYYNNYNNNFIITNPKLRISEDWINIFNTITLQFYKYT
jgi:hypothetical protein